MKIITIMEDRIHDPAYIYEHGLSFYIETKHHKILMDTGQSKNTWINARRLGINLEDIDTVVISHGHYDHAGGLLSFCKINSKARIYLNRNAIYDYYHYKNNEEKYIGIDHRIEQLPQVTYIEHNTQIDEELSIYTNIQGRRLWPQGNTTLHKRVENEYIQDLFDHEQCLVIHENNKYVLLSGCAHNGILNILDRFKEIYGTTPDLVLSGFHMLKSQGYTLQDQEDILTTANELKNMNTIFYTGHCTGIEPYEMMKKVMKDQLHYMYIGEQIDVCE